MYNVPSAEPTKAPVVLPAYTPAPQDDLESYGGHDSNPPSYDPTSFGDEEFPIVSLLTGDSDIPEDEKYVSFTFGSEPGQYQATADSSDLAQEVGSGSVYVQNPGLDNDELYYIYYQDPDQDPNYGTRVDAKRSAAPGPSATPEAGAAAAPARDIPLYDYEDADIEYLRDTREQPAEEYFGNYQNIGGHSSVSVNFNVGGKASGFSYNL